MIFFNASILNFEKIIFISFILSIFSEMYLFESRQILNSLQFFSPFWKWKWGARYFFNEKWKNHSFQEIFDSLLSFLTQIKFLFFYLTFIAVIIICQNVKLKQFLRIQKSNLIKFNYLWSEFTLIIFAFFFYFFKLFLIKYGTNNFFLLRILQFVYRNYWLQSIGKEIVWSFALFFILQKRVIIFNFNIRIVLMIWKLVRKVVTIFYREFFLQFWL